MHRNNAFELVCEGDSLRKSNSFLPRCVSGDFRNTLAWSRFATEYCPQGELDSTHPMVPMPNSERWRTLILSFLVWFHRTSRHHASYFNPGLTRDFLLAWKSAGISIRICLAFLWVDAFPRHNKRKPADGGSSIDHQPIWNIEQILNVMWSHLPYSCLF